MSSILKALKKLDAEKTARNPESFKIDSEILRGETRGRFSPFRIILASMLLFVCGGVATYQYMKHETTETVSTQNTISPVVHAERIPDRAIVPVTRIEETKIVPALPVISEPAKSAGKRSRSEQPPVVKQVSPKNKRTHPSTTVHQAEGTSRQPTVAAKPAQVPIQPQLRVNGIAFQDGMESVAMINGVQVIKGAKIEGVRVVDIQKDRVLFSFKGENFEIALGKSNR